MRPPYSLWLGNDRVPQVDAELALHLTVQPNSEALSYVDRRFVAWADQRDDGRPRRCLGREGECRAAEFGRVALAPGRGPEAVVEVDEVLVLDDRAHAAEAEDLAVLRTAHDPVAEAFLVPVPAPDVQHRRGRARIDHRTGRIVHVGGRVAVDREVRVRDIGLCRGDA